MRPLSSSRDAPRVWAAEALRGRPNPCVTARGRVVGPASGALEAAKGSDLDGLAVPGLGVRSLRPASSLGRPYACMVTRRVTCPADTPPTVLPVWGRPRLCEDAQAPAGQPVAIGWDPALGPPLGARGRYVGRRNHSRRAAACTGSEPPASDRIQLGELCEPAHTASASERIRERAQRANYTRSNQRMERAVAATRAMRAAPMKRSVTWRSSGSKAIWDSRASKTVLSSASLAASKN
jgi:hypothetical protein